MDKPEKPGDDATAAEIMQWMEEDFAWAVAEGVEEGVENEEDKENQE